MQERVDNYFMTIEDPYGSCLLFLRDYILKYSEKISEQRKNNTPFYYYEGKWLAFLSYDPKTKIIYLSFVNGYQMHHPKLMSEGRKKMKILYIDPFKDIDIKCLNEVLKMALSVR